MGKPTGFIEFQREMPTDRGPAERVVDWKEFHHHQPEGKLREQGARCNKEMVLLYRLRYPEEIEFVKDLVFRHAQLTGSARASKVLVDWDYFVPRFVRVVPNDYNRVLQAQRKMRETGLSPEEAEMAAFDLNVADVARVGGK